MLEKEVINKFVPRVIQRIAVKASTEVVEKWAGRVIPLVSSVIGAGLNYYFLRAWGRRAGSHFRQRHLELRSRMGDTESHDRCASGCPAVVVSKTGQLTQPFFPIQCPDLSSGRDTSQSPAYTATNSILRLFLFFTAREPGTTTAFSGTSSA